MTTDPNYNKWRMASMTPVKYCTFCVVVVGFIMLLAGAILSGIAYTEVRPNVADENYERYIRSDLKRVMGPILLAFGLLCIMSGCVFFGLSLFSASREQRRREKQCNKYTTNASREFIASTPDAEKKMLSDV